MQRVGKELGGPGAISAAFGTSGKSEAVITRAKQVDIYDLENHRCIESWSSGRVALSAGAVQHPASGELYAVLSGGAQLCSWKRSQKRMLDGATAQFSAKERVVSVHVSASVPGAVVVHADASISVLSEQLKPVCARWRPPSPKGAAKGKGAKPSVAAAVLSAKTGTSATMLLCTTAAGTGGASCVALDISGSSIRAGRSQQFDGPTEDSELVAAAHLATSDRIALVWSCLTLEVRDWLPNEVAAASALRVRRKFRQDRGLTPTTTMSICAAVAPSGVMIAGLAADDGAAATDLPVTLWDASYGTLQDEKVIPAAEAAATPQRSGESGKSKGAAAAAAAPAGVIHCAERGCALVVANGVCWSWTLRAKPTSLLHALGGLRGAQRYLADVELAPVAGQATIQSLGKENAPDSAAFSQKLSAYLSIRGGNSRGNADGKPKLKKGASVLLGAEVVRTAVQRCLRDHYWPDLERLLKTGQVSARSTPELLPTLMAQSQISLLQVCLTQVHDMPEPELIQLVRFLLDRDWGTGQEDSTGATQRSKRGKDKKKRKAAGDEDEQTTTSSLTEATVLAKPLEEMLSLVVSRPRNDVALLRSLRSLPIVNVVVLLQFFHSCLQQENPNLSQEAASQAEGQGAKQPKSKRPKRAAADTGSSEGKGAASAAVERDGLPSFAQVLDWTMLLLDAHFASLLVIPSCHELLRDLSRSVGDHSKLAGLLTPLKGVLAHFQKHANVYTATKQQEEREAQAKAKAAAEAKSRRDEAEADEDEDDQGKKKKKKSRKHNNRSKRGEKDLEARKRSKKQAAGGSASAESLGLPRHADRQYAVEVLEFV
jgi:hypothetical protein|eukprot:COSAG06_NODE_6085_length_3118_cov_2.624048_1_plen_828_part_00